MNPRLVALPALALALIAGVLGVQLAYGGGSFTPLTPADPCTITEVDTRADGIDGLTERLVLLGVADAACQLGISREQLTLELAQPTEPTDEDIDALRAGLKNAVTLMADDGSLPPPSELTDEALEQADLNPLLEVTIRAIPDSLIDNALTTEDVLTRAIDDLDLRDLLANIDEPDELNTQVEAAITQAVKDSLLDRLRNLI